MKYLLLLILNMNCWAGIITDSLIFPKNGTLQCGNQQYYLTLDTSRTFTLYDRIDSVVASSKFGANHVFDLLNIGDTFYFACKKTDSANSFYFDSSTLYLYKCLFRNDSLIPLDSIFIQNSTTSYVNQTSAIIATTDSSIIFLYKIDNKLTVTFLKKTNYSVKNAYTITCGNVIKVAANNLYTPIGNHIDIYSFLTPTSFLMADQWLFPGSVFGFCFNTTLDTIAVLDGNGLTIYSINSTSPVKVSLIYPFTPLGTTYVNYLNGSIWAAGSTSLDVYDILSQQQLISSTIYRATYRLIGNAVFCDLVNIYTEYEGKVYRFRDSLEALPLQKHPNSTKLDIMQIYPNPFRNDIKIVSRNPLSSITISIYNPLGQLIFNKNDFHSYLSWNADKMPNGLYIAKVNIDNHTYSKKIFHIK